MGRGRRVAALAVCPLLLAACGSAAHAPVSPDVTGPTGTIRVALDHVRWPLDPALLDGRDEATLAGALLATPLRVDRETGTLGPGLCSSWRSSDDGRRWRFRCRAASAIAAELRRVGRLRYAPAGWLFAEARRIAAPGPQTLVVVLRRPWRRFAYALTVPAAAPPGVPGRFRVVSASPRRIVARRGGRTLVFLRMAPRAALEAFRHGRVDEAPVPLGDLRRLRLDARLRSSVHVNPLLGVDLVGFRLAGGPLASFPGLRRVYWETADRGDYAALVPEYAASEAFAVLPGGGEGLTLRAARRARGRIRAQPALRIHVAVGPDPSLVYAAEEVAAQWGDVGLGARVETLRNFQRRLVDGDVDAWFRRLVAVYPQPEALLAGLLVPQDGRNPWLGRPSRARALLRRALAAEDPAALLERADDQLQRSAAVVPLAGVADARLVSPRLRGWHEDRLGVVDYTRVTAA